MDYPKLWRIFVYLTFLLQYLASSEAQVAGDCSPCWTLQSNASVLGAENQGGVNSEDACKTLCCNTDICIGVDWDRNFNSCWFQKGPKDIETSRWLINHWSLTRPNCAATTVATTTVPTTTTTTVPTTTTTTATTTTTTVATTTTTTAQTEPTTNRPTTSETSPSNISHSSPDHQSDNIGAIVGGVVGGFCGLVIIIAVLVVIILLARKRQRQEKLRGIGDDILMESDDKSTKRKPVVPRKPQLTLMPSLSTDPVSLTKLSSHFAILNSGDGVKEEFNSLPSANYESCGRAKVSENVVKKNRFKNILPYDETRVKLFDKDNGASDYINASYIQGYDGAQKVYIAAQGPLKTTLNDFWQMIWNEELNRIIMITQLVEQGKNKCEKYWPDGLNGSKEFHKVTVTLVECHACTDFTRRVMRVEHKDSSETRLVTQLHFTIWTDKGIPNEVYQLLAFRRRVRLLDDEATGPMLVHCSAGVGRTGTFIALDCLLEQAEKTSEVSVFGVVKKLREQRMIMVQMTDQYKLLYQAVLEANKTGVTDIGRNRLQQIFSIQNGNQHLPDSLETITESEFNLLEDVKRLNAVNAKSMGHQHDNLAKNRYTDTIPDDKVRIYLSPIAHQSDYINAVLTQGHRCHYILTQLPLKETIGDFWRMITERNCPAIVVLDCLNDPDELTYWPSDALSTLQFGKISVKLASKVKAGEILGLELQLKRTGASSQVVHLYRLSSWGKDLPDSATDVLDLIGILSDEHQQLLNPSEDADTDKAKKPFVIICPNGAQKSGLFAAASYLIDKLKSDRSADPYLSCRYVISSRPQAINSLAQYRYLFQLAAQYLNWTPTVTMDFTAGRAVTDIYENVNQSSINTIYANV